MRSSLAAEFSARGHLNPATHREASALVTSPTISENERGDQVCVDPNRNVRVGGTKKKSKARKLSSAAAIDVARSKYTAAIMTPSR